jgi:signal transduction histidine kinase
MNNPLTLIEGHIFRIKKLYPNEAALHESLDKVSLSVKKISKLTKSVRIFARNESGKGDFQEKLNTLFEEALAMLEHRLMQFQVDIDPQFKNFLIQGNCTEFFRVFLNLLSNSVDALQEASAEAKWIKISLNEDMTDIYLTFTDGGNGIPESVQKRLFEPFYTTKAVGKGTGMGLSLSRKIARDHDGDLVLDQSCPHTTFVMRIPKSRIQKL